MFAYSYAGVIKAVKGQAAYTVPDNFPYEQARELFKNPQVTPAKDLELKWTDPDVEGLTNFLVKEKQFDEVKVKNVVERLKSARKQKGQNRLDDFFKVLPKAASSSKPADKKGQKRKREDSKSKQPAKKPKK